MNNRNRAAWAQHLGSQRPLSPTGESERIVIPGRLPSKANNYEIRLDPGVWSLIRPLVEQWRKKTGKRPWWISPSAAVKAYEDMAATYIQAQERFRHEGPLALEIDLYGIGNDVDNIKCLGDACQASGIIKNDKQFTKLNVEKFDAKDSRIELYITRIK